MCRRCLYWFFGSLVRSDTVWRDRWNNDRTALECIQSNNCNENFMSIQTSPRSETPPDELRAQARSLVLGNQNPSIGFLQRQLKIGYNQALGLMQSLEGDIVSAKGPDGWRQMLETGARSPDDPLVDGVRTEYKTGFPSMETSMGSTPTRR